jgi:hypothetical protein
MFLAAHWDRLLEDLGVSKPTMVNKLKSFLGLERGMATPDIKGETPTSPQKALEKIEEVVGLYARGGGSILEATLRGRDCVLLVAELPVLALI